MMGIRATRAGLLALTLLCVSAAFARAQEAASQPESAPAPSAEPEVVPASAPAPGVAPTQEPPPEPPPYGEAKEETEAPSALSTLIRMALALGAVILLAYLLLHKGLGALSGRLAKGRLVRIVDRVGLEPKKTLYVVEVTGRYFLIGTSDHGVSCLATLETGAAKAAFEDLLRQGGGVGKPATGGGAEKKGGENA